MLTHIYPSQLLNNPKHMIAITLIPSFIAWITHYTREENMKNG